MYNILFLIILQFIFHFDQVNSWSLLKNERQFTGLGRRDSIKNIIGTLVLPTTASLVYNPHESLAVDANLLDMQAKKFRKVPVFAIVDQKTGVPFMILRNTGLATAYFFTSYEGAQLVLDDARRDAKEKDLQTREFWEGAKISATSMEFALKLSKGRPRAKAQNGVKYETVYDIIPSLKALEDAGRLDKSGIYSEQGRVPLFYMREFEIMPEVDGGEKRIPVFFDREQLVMEWKKRYPDVEVPPIRVVDLIDTFTTMIEKGSTITRGASTDERIINKLVPIASSESKMKAIVCEKARGDVPAYKTGEMIAVGGKE